MFGHGMMNAGTWAQYGNEGARVLRDGAHHAGGFGIAGCVLGIVLWAAVMIALILLIMTLIRNWRRPQQVQLLPPDGTTPAVAAPSPEALKVLEDRYARGELNHDEYLERKRDLTGS